jgi:hypothetical protein
MKISSLLVAACFILEALSSSPAADAVTDPIKAFLFDNSDPDDAYYRSQLESVYELKLDIDGSGKETVLLTMNGMNSAHGYLMWEGYRPVHGGYQKIEAKDANFYFRPDTFYVGYIRFLKRYGLLTYEGGHGGGDLNLNQVVNGQLIVRKIREIHISHPEDIKLLDTYFGETYKGISLRKHPIKEMNLDDLRKAGYNVDAAIKAAQACLPSAYPSGN